MLRTKSCGTTTMGTELRDCPYCGLPLEVVSQWVLRYPATPVMPHPQPVHMATARCLSDHWYAGPAVDLYL